VLQQVTTDNVAGVSVNKEDLDQEDEEKSFTRVDIAVSMPNNFDASTRAIPDTTQNIEILSDDEFDEVV
jgi:hypothetical protein